MTGTTSIDYVTLEVDDPTAAERFYSAAFGLGSQLRRQASEAPTAGFRGFTLSLLVSEPATVDGFVRAARSFARVYAEFAAPAKHIKLGLYKHRALAKDAGVCADGTGSHRLGIGSGAGPCTDPDGFAWEASARKSAPDASGRPEGHHHQRSALELTQDR